MNLIAYFLKKQQTSDIEWEGSTTFHSCAKSLNREKHSTAKANVITWLLDWAK